MLVLTRKTGQKLYIDETIVITILESKGEAVKIGIEAPKNVTIYREEIYEEIKKANQQATEIPQNLENVLNLLDSGNAEQKS